jgi:5'-phosphate synthase pdxT subunit
VSLPRTRATSPQFIVLGFQGNVSEHVEAIHRALDRLSAPGTARSATDARSITEAAALAIPGGESTTISRLIAANGLKKPIRWLADSGRPIIGTCAGLILLSKIVNGKDQSGNPGFPSVIDASVLRNAYGSQRESFEAELELKLPKRTARETGVFIRAPAIERTWGSCTPIAWVDGKPVAALQGNILGTCFHPELSGNSEIYEFLLRRTAQIG